MTDTLTRSERAARSIAVDYSEVLDLIDPDRQHRDMLLSLLAISWCNGALEATDDAGKALLASVAMLETGLA